MNDQISRQWLMECVNEGWIKFDTEKDENRFMHLVRDIAPPAQPEIIRCKDCIHRPIVDDPDAKDGFGLQFPDFRCPCRCDDGYYSWMPKDNWFCGNGEKEEKTNE